MFYFESFVWQKTLIAMHLFIFSMSKPEHPPEPSTPSRSPDPTRKMTKAEKEKEKKEKQKLEKLAKERDKVRLNSQIN